MEGEVGQHVRNGGVWVLVVWFLWDALALVFSSWLIQRSELYLATQVKYVRSETAGSNAFSGAFRWNGRNSPEFSGHFPARSSRKPDGKLPAKLRRFPNGKRLPRKSWIRPFPVGKLTRAQYLLAQWFHWLSGDKSAVLLHNKKYFEPLLLFNHLKTPSK